MARIPRGLRGLGSMRSPDRFIVFNVGATHATKRGYGDAEPCSRRVFTSYGDAAKATLRCSRQGKKKGVASVTGKPCLLLHGMPGSETLVGRCLKGKCSQPEPGDRRLMERCKLDKKKAKGARRELIARLHADRARGIGPSKASKSGVFPREKLPAELQGRRKRKAKH